MIRGEKPRWTQKLLGMEMDYARKYLHITDENLIHETRFRVNPDDRGHHVPEVISVTLKANPDPGVVAIPSWFWIQGYDGGIVTHSKTQHASHTECRLFNGVPDCHTVDDSVTVNVRLTPTTYTWNFGDGRSGSVHTYLSHEGLGWPYTDAVHASPVQWSYEFDSRDFASGFPIKVTITFSGVFQANGSGWQGLPNIDDSWTTGLVMRQVQTLNVVPPSLGGAQKTAPQR